MYCCKCNKTIDDFTRTIRDDMDVETITVKCHGESDSRTFSSLHDPTEDIYAFMFNGKFEFTVSGIKFFNEMDK